MHPAVAAETFAADDTETSPAVTELVRGRLREQSESFGNRPAPSESVGLELSASNQFKHSASQHDLGFLVDSPGLDRFRRCSSFE